jgi:hypothetical protein
MVEYWPIPEWDAHNDDSADLFVVEFVRDQVT